MGRRNGSVDGLAIVAIVLRRHVSRNQLALAPGELTGLIGSNGAGKTTLLRVILGLLAPTRGSVDIAGPRRGSVGYVPQKLNIDANLPLTVGDLLALALQRRPLFLGIRSRVRKQMAALLDQVNAPTAYGAERSMKMDFDEYDKIDDFELNEILWRSIKGKDAPIPPAVL